MTRASARQQQVMNRLAHCRWHKEASLARLIADAAVFCLCVAPWIYLLAFIGGGK